MDKDSSSNAHRGMCRREFLGIMAAASATFAGVTLVSERPSPAEAIAIKDTKPGEDIFAYVTRVKGGFDQTLYQQVIGASNAFKEGDHTIGVGADNEATRRNARTLLANTKIKDLYEHPLLVDDLQKLIWQSTNQARYEKVKDWTMAYLKVFLLTKSEAEIKDIMVGLTSDTIGCVPKLMTNEELITIGQKIFNPMPGTQMGAKGYMGARIQPNPPPTIPTM